MRITFIAKGKSSLVVIIPIALSAFTHLWNPVGFPDIFYDEGAYLRRAMIFLDNQVPQESDTYYDHPYFGQILMAGLFAVVGFPDSLDPTDTVQSIESLFLVPKILMGSLAVLDTFLVYKIVQCRYVDSRAAFLASILFAVMPITWITRRILLDSLLLPFLLSSILFAIALKQSNRQYIMLLLSGICLGLAIFTKLPAFTAIPLIGLLLYPNIKANKLKYLSLWLVPVILIPLLWPAYSLSAGQFEYWVKGILSQTQRQSDGVATIFSNFWKVDPVLMSLGMFGFGYLAVIKRDFFPLLWVGPFLIFTTFIGYVQYFHVIPLLAAFCISAALFLSDITKRFTRARLTVLLQYCLIASIGLFGLISTTLLITTDVTSSQFEAMAFVLKLSDEDTTIIANPAYSWLYTFVYDMPYALTDYRDALYRPLPTDKVILVSEPHFQANILEGRQLQLIYKDTTNVKTLYGNVRSYDVRSYPYVSLILTSQGEVIEIRQKIH